MVFLDKIVVNIVFNIIYIIRAMKRPYHNDDEERIRDYSQDPRNCQLLVPAQLCRFAYSERERRHPGLGFKTVYNDSTIAHSLVNCEKNSLPRNV